VWRHELAQTDFIALIRERHPHLMPTTLDTESSALAGAPHGTTILALRYADGVIIAGDRQATSGYEIADRNIEKVFTTDDHSAIAIAGVAGPAIQMAKLLRTQLEFYEKVEGTVLTLEGKANYLGLMIRQNFPAAIQGLIVVPIFAGYDLRRNEGRIFKYDITGGRYEEAEYFATGSGGKDARTTFKKRYRRRMPLNDALRAAVEALIDASDEDTATGGVDDIRGIYPTIKTVTRDGIHDVGVSDIRQVTEGIRADLRELHAPDDE